MTGLTNGVSKTCSQLSALLWSECCHLNQQERLIAPFLWCELLTRTIASRRRSKWWLGMWRRFVDLLTYFSAQPYLLRNTFIPFKSPRRAWRLRRLPTQRVSNSRLRGLSKWKGQSAKKAGNAISRLRVSRPSCNTAHFDAVVSVG